MKKLNYTYLILGLLFLLSLGTYLFQIFEFHDPRNTAFYFLQDMAFLPVQVGLVTVVIGNILNQREKRERLKKTNTMLSTFFSEVGDDLLEELCQLHTSPQEVSAYLAVKDTWVESDFNTALQRIRAHHFHMNCSSADLEKLKQSLSEKRQLILAMLQNPNLLEHDTFTDLLFALFHVTDELLCRSSLDDLPDADMAHLNHDLLRAFRALLVHWIHYMQHLKTEYPYLFSFEVRKNPFAAEKSIVFY